MFYHSVSQNISSRTSVLTFINRVSGKSINNPCPPPPLERHVEREHL